MKRIMLVEDERILALTLRRELQQNGYEVVGIASSAVEAVATAKASTPDLIVMDISIDGPHDGIEAAHQIGAFCNASVVYVTGETDLATRTRASKSPCYEGYMTKPLVFQELHVLISQIIKRRLAKTV